MRSDDLKYLPLLHRQPYCDAMIWLTVGACFFMALCGEVSSVLIVDQGNNHAILIA